MTETANLSYQEVKEILAIFQSEKIKCWDMNWQFETSSDYIKKKIDENENLLRSSG